MLGSTEQRLFHNNIDDVQRDGRALRLWGVRVGRSDGITRGGGEREGTYC